METYHSICNVTQFNMTSVCTFEIVFSTGERKFYEGRIVNIKNIGNGCFRVDYRPMKKTESLTVFEVHEASNDAPPNEEVYVAMSFDGGSTQNYYKVTGVKSGTVVGDKVFTAIFAER